VENPYQRKNGRWAAKDGPPEAQQKGGQCLNETEGVRGSMTKNRGGDGYRIAYAEEAIEKGNDGVTKGGRVFFDFQGQEEERKG